MDPFVVNLYWDGNVNYVNGNVMYDEDTKKSSIVVQQKLSYENFLDLCYAYVGVSKDSYKLSLFLLYEFQGMQFSSEILGDESLEMLYYFASRDRQYWGHILIKREAIIPVYCPPITQSFQHISVADEARASGYEHQQHDADQQLPSRFTEMATTSTYGHNRYTAPSDVSTRDMNEDEGRAIVGGFEASSEDVSSEHSNDDVDSSLVVSDEDDDSDELGDDNVAETLHATQPRTVTTLDQEGEYEILPEWADDEEQLDMWCASTDVIRCGMCFKGKQELDHAVRLWNISRGREIIIVDSSRSVYKAKCYSIHKDDGSLSQEPQCGWLVRASKKKHTTMADIQMGGRPQLLWYGGTKQQP